MDDEKRNAKTLINKKVVSKTGKVFGEVSNIIFETRNGELLQLVLKNTTGYCDGLDLEKTAQSEILLPYGSVVALGDFIVVDEQEII